MNRCLICGKSRIINFKKMWNNIFTLALDDNIYFFSVCPEHLNTKLSDIHKNIILYKTRVFIKKR